MSKDRTDPYRHEPPPGLTEQELRRWQQWRKFTWLKGDTAITKRGDGKKSGEGDNGGRNARTPDPEGRSW